MHVIHQRPTGAQHVVEFIAEVVDLEHELHADRREAALSVAVVLSTRNADPEAITFNGPGKAGFVTPTRVTLNRSTRV
ncbi:MAG: hypothetical protein ABI873_06460 [Marmoricola sp.]